jgi:hypothetical protein
MIRLGSLAGYPFEGPRVLAGWSPPAAAGVFVVMYRPAPESAPDRYAVIYVGQAEDLSSAGFPFRHPASACWIRRAGGKYDVHVATYEIPGGLLGHRQQLVDELLAVYRPQCNAEQLESAWEEHWIGSYEAPTTGPLTTGRDPGPPREGQPREGQPTGGQPTGS